MLTEPAFRVRSTLWLVTIILGLFLTVDESQARGSRAARVTGIVAGIDRSLPSYVKLTPCCGYFGSGPWIAQRRKLPRFQDGQLHFAHYVHFSWREANPEEGVYNWGMIDQKIKEATAAPGSGFVFWIGAYGRYSYTRYKWARSEKQRKRTLRDSCMVPDWVIEKGKVRFLSNGAVAAWEPGCGYQKYFGKFLRALGARYKEHPKLIGVDMRGLDCRYGEWCWRDGPRVLHEAETKTGLTPESLRRWGEQFINDFVEAFEGQEHKLVWPNADEVFIPKRGTEYDYGPASCALWKLAFAKGCGVRDGMPTVWFRYISPGWGCQVTDDGYLVFDETYAPLCNGAMMYSENSEYRGEKDPSFGPASMNGVRFFITTMRVLQLRRSWQWIPWRIMDQIEKQIEPYGGDAFVRWVEYEMGKRPETSPDAWCWLREGYRARWAGYRPIKNFERWLLQRDVAPDGHTVPTEKIDISMLEYNYASGKGYEFHARRTDRASGSKYIYFRAERRFVSGGPHHMLLKVTYLDGPKTIWCIEYSGKSGFERSGVVETMDSGKWKTVTFELPDMRFSGAFRRQMDFRLVLLGPADVTVKLVRLIKPEKVGS